MVRGILNGTTNYILTKMFTKGESFDNALKNAQAHGYAERNPDADILGTDASRKIAILGAIMTGKLISVDKIHTEGITAIRGEDVRAAELADSQIKLLGRCVQNGDKPYIMVAPFMISNDSALAGVSGVYNAVEVVASPLGNVMFYGKGAGAGATASAVVGDLMQIIAYGALGMPTFEKSDDMSDFGGFVSRHYLAFEKCDEDKVLAAFECEKIDCAECAVITEALTEDEVNGAISALVSDGAKLLSHIRVL